MLVQTRLLLVLSLIGAVTASRVQPKTQKHERASTSKAWSPWEVSYQGLTCGALEPQPFVGIKANWPKCWAQAAKTAADLATNGNCKLCDLTFAASKPEKDQGMMSTGCSAVVTCAVARLGPEACDESNGKVGAVQGLNDVAAARAKTPEMACYPCPQGCGECFAIAGRMSGFQKKFKCVSSPMVTASGATFCKTPEEYSCGECSKRTCSGYIPDWATFMTDWYCSKEDYKATCDFPATYNKAEAAVAHGPQDFSITLKAGEDKTALPPVLDYLSTV